MLREAAEGPAPLRVEHHEPARSAARAAASRVLRRSFWWGQLRRVQHEGLLNAASRRRVWSQVLETAPVTTAAHSRDALYELHLICCFADYLAAMWALKSYLGLVGGGECHLHLHLQGVAPPLMRARLQHHFPRAHLTLQREADERIVPLLLARGFTRLVALRAGLPVMLKLVDVALTGELPRVLILDSDVLFFKHPRELHAAITGREVPVLFQQDVWSCYALTPAQALADLDVPLIERLNSGIVAIDRGLINLAMCERFLGHPSLRGRSGWTEQTLFALLASATGRARLLPPSYAISMEPEPAPDQLVARHYSGTSRRWLTASGMPWLLAQQAAAPPFAPRASSSDGRAR